MPPFNQCYNTGLIIAVGRISTTYQPLRPSLCARVVASQRVPRWLNSRSAESGRNRPSPKVCQEAESEASRAFAHFITPSSDGYDSAAELMFSLSGISPMHVDSRPVWLISHHLTEWRSYPVKSQVPLIELQNTRSISRRVLIVSTSDRLIRSIHAVGVTSESEHPAKFLCERRGMTDSLLVSLERSETMSADTRDTSRSLPCPLRSCNCT